MEATDANVSGFVSVAGAFAGICLLDSRAITLDKGTFVQQWCGMCTSSRSSNHQAGDARLS